MHESGADSRVMRVKYYIGRSLRELGIEYSSKGFGANVARAGRSLPLGDRSSKRSVVGAKRWRSILPTLRCAWNWFASFFSRAATKEAKAAWHRALELEPANARTLQELVRFLIVKGRREEARELSATLDATKFPKPYDRRYYKDFTAEEKCTLLEASLVTIASAEAIVELIRAVGHVLRNDIPGAFIECGTFQGGNAVVMIRTLLNAGITDRDIYLYDTFEGFPKPEAVDFEYLVGPALDTWNKFRIRAINPRTVPTGCAIRSESARTRAGARLSGRADSLREGPG